MMHPMGRIKQAFARWRHITHPHEPRAARIADGSVDEQIDLRAALTETAHERDVSMARASEAEERERLARERLASLASLEHRVEAAERRALDAERRLEEISDRVNGPQEILSEPDQTVARPAGATAELRARLARAAERKRPRSG
jgi:hypothetical protein